MIAAQKLEPAGLSSLILQFQHSLKLRHSLIYDGILDTTAVHLGN